MPLSPQQRTAVDTLVIISMLSLTGLSTYYASDAAIKQNNIALELAHLSDPARIDCHERYQSYSDCPFFTFSLSIACRQVCGMLESMMKREHEKWAWIAGSASAGLFTIYQGYKAKLRCSRERAAEEVLRAPLVAEQQQNEAISVQIEPEQKLSNTAKLEEANIAEQDYWDDFIERGFICPISQTVMDDPVVAWDGITYEREVIKEWLDLGKTTSPMGNNSQTDYPFHRHLRTDIVRRGQINAAVETVISASPAVRPSPK